jgi:hypothetical protein
MLCLTPPSSSCGPPHEGQLSAVDESFDAEPATSAGSEIVDARGLGNLGLRRQLRARAPGRQSRDRQGTVGPWSRDHLQRSHPVGRDHGPSPAEAGSRISPPPDHSVIHEHVIRVIRTRRPPALAVNADTAPPPGQRKRLKFLRRCAPAGGKYGGVPGAGNARERLGTLPGRRTKRPRLVWEVVIGDHPLEHEDPDRPLPSTGSPRDDVVSGLH